MTLAEAVAILNAKKHMGWDRWYRSSSHVLVSGSLPLGGGYPVLEYDEAIAAAMKYERDGQ